MFTLFSPALYRFDQRLMYRNVYTADRELFCKVYGRTINEVNARLAIVLDRPRARIVATNRKPA